MNEIWIEFELNKNNHMQTAIVAVSNKGNMKRRNGVIEPIPLRQVIVINSKHYVVSRLLAEHFIPKTEEDTALGRNVVDHITHNPIGMNINDVRNLRWCTQKENCNFDECINNMKGREAWNKGKQLRGLYDYTFSEEHKKKISEARKRYWERVKNADKLQEL